MEISRTLCIAPMMAWTDRHCRYLLRLASPNSLLFTEMITASALIHGDAARLLAFHRDEHPVALQLGGSDPESLAAASRRATEQGYDEINLNVGCPSPRVQRGQFGACLMLQPELVARCVRAMVTATRLPVTVKCRLGVDDADSDALLHRFVGMLVDAGCSAVYLHARKALLDGLTPAQNRDVPPLQPERVYAVKRRYPSVPVIFNGGVREAETVQAHLRHTDGVMVGRAAYQSPGFIARLDAHLFGGTAVTEAALARGYLDYIDRELANGTRLHDMTRHMLGLFKGGKGARRYRRLLSDTRRVRADDISVVHDALAAVSERAA